MTATTHATQAPAAAAEWEALPLPGFDFGDATPEQRSITASFWRFHRENEQVYAQLVALARQLKAKDHQRYGIGSLFEVLRWHQATLQTRGDVFRLNNNLRSRYSRLIEAQEPDLRGFFVTRALHGDFELDGGPR